MRGCRGSEGVTRSGSGCNSCRCSGEHCNACSGLLGKIEHVKVLLDRKCGVLLDRNQKGETHACIAKKRELRDIALLLDENADGSSDQAVAKLLISLSAEENKKKPHRTSRKRHKKTLQRYLNCLQTHSFPL